MNRVLGNWWLKAAALIAGLEFLVAVGIWVDRLTNDSVETGPLYGDVLLTGVIALAGLAVVVGLSSRTDPDRRAWLISAGVAPATLAGIVFFWFPPFWPVTILAVAVMVTALRQASAEPATG